MRSLSLKTGYTVSPKVSGRVTNHFVQMENASLMTDIFLGFGDFDRICRARSAIPSSAVAIAPPPKHGIFFPSAKLYRPTSPKVPTCWPSILTPQAWAQSKDPDLF